MLAKRTRDSLELAAILDHDVGIVEIGGAVPDEVSDYARALIDEQALPGPLEARCRPGDAESFTRRLANLSGRASFTAWLDRWLSSFAAVNDVQEVGIRVSHLRASMCPRFHVDMVPTRLITTLTGPGTEWIPQKYVSHDANGRIEQAVDPDVIERLETGAIGMLKGAVFEEARFPGIVHRSPPGGQDRVVVTFDAVV